MFWWLETKYVRVCIKENQSVETGVDTCRRTSYLHNSVKRVMIRCVGHIETKQSYGSNHNGQMSYTQKWEVICVWDTYASKSTEEEIT